MSIHEWRGRESLTALILNRRVERGIRWLNQHAPPCWHRNFFDPLERDSKSHFRGRMVYDNECPLALAFESRAELANKFGYVTEASVVRHFALTTRWLITHGFLADSQTADVRLDAEWELKLRHHRPEWAAAFRHQTALDREFVDLDFGLGPPKGRLRRLLAGVPFIGKGV
jgi:hypothetical protein